MCNCPMKKNLLQIQSPPRNQEISNESSGMVVEEQKIERSGGRFAGIEISATARTGHATGSQRDYVLILAVALLADDQHHNRKSLTQGSWGKRTCVVVDRRIVVVLRLSRVQGSRNFGVECVAKRFPWLGLQDGRHIFQPQCGCPTS